MSDLTLTQVSNLIASPEQFPVDFESAWRWLKYSNKDNALRTLKSNFQKGVEFSSTRMENARAGRPSVSYYLTNDCFKMLAMMAGTEKGKEIRRYYVECERQLKNVAALPVTGLERFDSLLARAKDLQALDPSDIRASLERALLIEIEPTIPGRVNLPQMATESKLLMAYIAKRGNAPLREIQRSCCLKRRGVTRVGDYRSRLGLLVEAGKIVENDGCYSIAE